MSVRNLLNIMDVLSQCIDILNLTSFDWDKSRIAVVAHSFRVMSRSKNYDEMVVGIMHHVYASSSYARRLFKCDVYENTLWKEALDLFVEKRKRIKSKVPEDLPDKMLLGLNLEQKLKTEKLDDWIAEECRWSSKYKRKIEGIGTNRIARNVMLYNLEDKLQILIHPEKFWEERSEKTPLPETDDSILLRPLTKSERGDLVDKYSRAISLLMRMECADVPREEDFPDEKIKYLPDICMKWYDKWLCNEIALKEMHEEGKNDERL